MAKIKKLSIFDGIKIKKLTSVLESRDLPSLVKMMLISPFIHLQSILPINFKKLPEAYVSVEDNEINGMVMLKASHGNAYKWHIMKLYLTPNSYIAGRQLVDYILSKFGAYGANTFCVIFNNSYEELLDLFSKGCGFRLCSHENLWKMSEVKLEYKESDNIFRPFKNSDAKEVCEIYNDSIFPHFRYSLAKSPGEFKDRLFQGFSSISQFKYVMTDGFDKKILSYVEIQTNDNKNYFVEIVLPQPYEEYYPTVLGFAVNQIIRRRKDFNMFVWNKNYMNTAKTNADFMRNQGFKHIQNNAVLVKDFYKTISSYEKIAKPAIAFSEISRKPAFEVAPKEV